jgi:hypothetical protein
MNSHVTTALISSHGELPPPTLDARWRSEPTPDPSQEGNTHASPTRLAPHPGGGRGGLAPGMNIFFGTKFL